MITVLLADDHTFVRGSLVELFSASGHLTAVAACAAGAQVRFVSAYERRTPHLDAAGGALLRRAIERPRQHVWIFSSSESIDHLQTLCEAAGLRPRWPEFLALATHPRIAAAARRAGIDGVMECTPAVADVVRSIQSLAP